MMHGQKNIKLFF